MSGQPRPKVLGVISGAVSTITIASAHRIGGKITAAPPNSEGSKAHATTYIPEKSGAKNANAAVVVFVGAGRFGAAFSTKLVKRRRVLFI
jgi:hypothetical protein